MPGRRLLVPEPPPCFRDLFVHPVRAPEEKTNTHKALLAVLCCVQRIRMMCGVERLLVFCSMNTCVAIAAVLALWLLGRLDHAAMPASEVIAAMARFERLLADLASSGSGAAVLEGRRKAMFSTLLKMITKLKECSGAEEESMLVAIHSSSFQREQQNILVDALS